MVGVVVVGVGVGVGLEAAGLGWFLGGAVGSPPAEVRGAGVA